MANQRLGKRERQLIKLASESIAPKRQRPIAGVVADPRYMRSPKGSINGVDAMKGATHGNFRGKGAAYGVREISHGKGTRGLVADVVSWQRQAPLPELERATLLKMERGHKVTPAPERIEPVRTFYATAKATKLFTKGSTLSKEQEKLAAELFERAAKRRA